MDKIGKYGYEVDGQAFVSLKGYEKEIYFAETVIHGVVSIGGVTKKANSNYGSCSLKYAVRDLNGKYSLPGVIIQAAINVGLISKRVSYNNPDANFNLTMASTKIFRELAAT